MKYLRQQNGLTLVEILAVITLASIISISLMNLLLTSNKQYNSQVTEATNLNDLSFISKELTKDFRKSTSVEIGENIVKLSSANYTYSSNILKRDNSAYVTKIKTFCIASTQSSLKTKDCTKITLPIFNNEQGIYIFIENIDGRKIETTLFTRGGS